MTQSRSLILTVLVAIVLSLGLTGCGDEPAKQAMVSVAEAQARADKAHIDGKAEEAKLADGKLAKAKSEISKLAEDTARAGKFASKANCDVQPDGFGATSAARDFPGSVRSMYRESCQREVDRLVAVRKANDDRAVAKAKKADHKLAKQDEDRKLARQSTPPAKAGTPAGNGKNS